MLSYTVSVEGIPDQAISEIDGVTICMVTSEEVSTKSYNYLDAIRADPKTGKCPEPFVACSDQTSAKNTFCVEPSERPSLCPITDIRIIEKDKVAIFIANSDNGPIKYEEVSAPTGFDLNWAVLISKDFDKSFCFSLSFDNYQLKTGLRNSQ